MQVVYSQERAPAEGCKGGERLQHLQPTGDWPDSLESSAPFLFPPTSFLLLFSTPHLPPPLFSLSQISSSRKQRARALQASALKPCTRLAASHSEDQSFPGSTSPPQRPPPPALARSLPPARCLPHLRGAGRKAAGAQDGFSRALRPARLLLGAGGGAGHGRGRRGSFQGAGVQAEEHHGVGAAFPARERPEYHAQPLGLRAQAPLLGTQRLPGRNGRGGRPGEHGAALLRAGWVPGEVEALARRPHPPPPTRARSPHPLAGDLPSPTPTSLDPPHSQTILHTDLQTGASKLGLPPPLSRPAPKEQVAGVSLKPFPALTSQLSFRSTLTAHFLAVPSSPPRSPFPTPRPHAQFFASHSLGPHLHPQHPLGELEIGIQYPPSQVCAGQIALAESPVFTHWELFFCHQVAETLWPSFRTEVSYTPGVHPGKSYLHAYM